MTSSTGSDFRSTRSDLNVSCSMLAPSGFCGVGIRSCSSLRAVPVRTSHLSCAQRVADGTVQHGQHHDPSNAEVRLPDGATALWSLASLPRGVQISDLMRITEVGLTFTVEIEWIGHAHHTCI